MLNDPWLAEQSRAIAAGILAETAGTRVEIFDQAARWILGRRLNEKEQRAFDKYFGPDSTAVNQTQLSLVVQTLIRSIDFRFVE